MRTIFFLLSIISFCTFGQDYGSIAREAAGRADLMLRVSDVTPRTTPIWYINSDGMTAHLLPACACDFIIPATAWYVDVNKTTNANAYVINPKPGQTVCFANGTRAVVEFHNINGAEGLPITFVSCDGTTIKGNAGQHVVQFYNSSFIVIDGGPGHNIDITGGGHGIYFRDLSTNVKAARIRFHDLGYSGFEAKTDPSCDPKTWRGAFTLQYPVVDDCDFINLGGEAIYIGESHYDKVGSIQGGPCTSGVTTAQEHDVIGARVTNCRFNHIGRDGIQIGASLEMYIANNKINDFGYTKEPLDANGITWNPGSTGEVAYNTINTGSGFGILAQGRGSGKIHHNLIVGTGGAFGGGVMLAAYAPIDAAGYEVYNNTIIANRVGIEVYSANNIHDNIIAVPAGATLIKKAGTAAISQVNNIQVTGDATTLKLDAAYTPLPDSPAYRDSGDAGAVQAYRPPKTVVEDGKVTVEVTGTVEEVYITTSSGKRIKLK